MKEIWSRVLLLRNLFSCSEIFYEVKVIFNFLFKYTYFFVTVFSLFLFFFSLFFFKIAVFALEAKVYFYRTDVPIELFSDLPFDYSDPYYESLWNREFGVFFPDVCEDPKVRALVILESFWLDQYYGQCCLATELDSTNLYLQKSIKDYLIFEKIKWHHPDDAFIYQNDIKASKFNLEFVEKVRASIRGHAEQNRLNMTILDQRISVLYTDLLNSNSLFSSARTEREKLLHDLYLKSHTKFFSVSNLLSVGDPCNCKLGPFLPCRSTISFFLDDHLKSISVKGHMYGIMNEDAFIKDLEEIFHGKKGIADEDWLRTYVEFLNKALARVESTFKK